MNIELKKGLKTTTDERWLERWLPLIKERVGDRPLLELGCGWGWDSAVLCAAGFTLIGLDQSKRNLEMARKAAPSATFIEQDLRDPLPDRYAPYGVIIASLCLHYFPWDETERLIEKIADHLGPNGLLICRVNSVKDVNHGAVGHPEIAHHFYQVDQRTKRFFDESDLRRLFNADWNILSIEEYETNRFEKPKWVWETVLEKV